MLDKALALSPLPPVLTLLVLAAIAIAIIRHHSLQRPLPGIPYRAESAYTFMGDLSAIKAEHPDYRRSWLAKLPEKLGSPVVQLLIEPCRRPWVLVSDFREARDICQRRTDEFDRAYRSYEHFGPVLPEHHITMKTSDPRFHTNKMLIKPLMQKPFLHSVSLLSCLV